MKFTSIVKGVRSAYPNFKFIESEEGFKLWLSALSDTPDEVVSVAFHKHILTEKYPPSIAQIRERILELTSNSVSDWTEAFDLTRRAISLFGSYREFEALEWIKSRNEVAAEVTRRLGFKEICLAENVDVIRGQYRMAYERYADNKKNFEMLPIGVRKRQEELQDKYAINNLIKELGDGLSL